jgi:hypothetical protein
MNEMMLKSGEKLLQALRKRRFPFQAALWVYLSEAEEWRMFLAVPRARTQGKMKFYSKLQDALTQEPDLLPLSALAIVDAKDPLIYAMGPGIKVADVARHQFSQGTINGRYFEDAYVYRPRA